MSRMNSDNDPNFMRRTNWIITEQQQDLAYGSRCSAKTINSQDLMVNSEARK